MPVGVALAAGEDPFASCFSLRCRPSLVLSRFSRRCFGGAASTDAGSATVATACCCACVCAAPCACACASAC